MPDDTTTAPPVDAPSKRFRDMDPEEQRQFRRDNLARAREKKARMIAEGTFVPKEHTKRSSRAAQRPEPDVAPDLPSPPIMQASASYMAWTEQQWLHEPLDVAKSRLMLLKHEFDLGSTTVGKREDQNSPSTYRCFVCNKPIPEQSPSGKGPGWVFKHDYLNKRTGLFESVVMDTQYCHTVFANDRRLQQRFKDLISGVAADKQPDTKDAA